MSTGSLLYPIGYVFLDDNGAPVNAGKVYFSRTGTSTAQDTYSDSTLDTANANPVVLNSAGRSDTPIYGDPSTGFDYRVRLATAADVQIWQHDDVLVPGSDVARLDAANTFEAVQSIEYEDAGLSLHSTGTASNTEAFVAGFIRDDALTERKVGAEAFTWGDNDATSGYGVWNLHCTTLTAGVASDVVSLLLSGNHGATFFPVGFAAADLPGVDGTVRILAPAGKGQLNFRNPGGDRVSYGLSGDIEADTSTDGVVFAQTGIRFYVNGSATPVLRIGTAGIAEYADDAAAAAGSVPVGGMYRTGSVLKVRVA